MIIGKHDTRRVRTDGKVFDLPRVLVFAEGMSPGTPHMWEPDSFRAPKAGEWFVSGSIPSAYKAVADGTNEYLIVLPGRKMKAVSGWAPAD